MPHTLAPLVIADPDPDANTDVVLGPLDVQLASGRREQPVPDGALTVGQSGALTVGRSGVIAARGAARPGLTVAFAGRAGHAMSTPPPAS